MKKKHYIGLVLGFILSIVTVTSALADLLQPDADGLAPVDNNQTLNFGEVCSGKTYTKNVIFTARRVNPNYVWANNAVITVGLSPIPGSGISVNMLDDNIVLPGDWSSKIDNTLSSTLYGTTPEGIAIGTALAEITIVPVSSSTGSVRFNGTGLGSDGGTTVRFTTITLSWTVVTCQTNQPPTVDAGGGYSGDEGSPIQLKGTASDPDNDPLTYTWSYTTPDTLTCAFNDSMVEDPTITCDDSGSMTLTLTVSDGVNGPVSDTTNLTVLNIEPTRVSASFASASAVCRSDNGALTINFPDTGALNTHTAFIDWGDGNTETVNLTTSPFTRSHTYNSGVHTATVTVTDDNTGVGTATASLTVEYVFVGGGILQPINLSPPNSIFKWGSTIPVKVKVTDCNNTPVNSLTPKVTWKMLSVGEPDESINEPSSTSAADTGNSMRFSGDQYIFNLATKCATTATSACFPDDTASYRLYVTIESTGQQTTADIGIKSK